MRYANSFPSQNRRDPGVRIIYVTRPSHCVLGPNCLLRRSESRAGNYWHTGFGGSDLAEQYPYRQAITCAAYPDG